MPSKKKLRAQVAHLWQIACDVKDASGYEGDDPAELARHIRLKIEGILSAL